MFDRFIAVDWSAAKSPPRGAMGIWLATQERGAIPSPAVNATSRADAEARLSAEISRARFAGIRLLIAIDVSFGAPHGIARQLAGRDDATALWTWLEARITDDPPNHAEVAADANRSLGAPAFWGHLQRAEMADLPRRRPPLANDLHALRQTERVMQVEGYRPKSLFQMAYAGAVGAQSLLAMPMLLRLRSHGAAVWPFDPPGPVTLVETYLAAVDPVARHLTAACHDAAQVQAMAAALAELDRSGGLDAMFCPPATAEILHDEGWTLGAELAHLFSAAAAEGLS